MWNEILELAAELGQQMQSNKLSLAVAESCTGGLLASAITAVPGSSAFFYGGIVAYSNEAKLEYLAVSRSNLENWGAVSYSTVLDMARGLRMRTKVDLALSISGVAGPAGSEKKPVGLVYIGLVGKRRELVSVNYFSGGREQVRLSAVLRALVLLRSQAGFAI